MKILESMGLFLASVCVAAVVSGFPVMWIWNWLITDLFELRDINFWEALCLSILAKILFTSSSDNK